MFGTFVTNFKRHTLLRAAVYIVLGSAILFRPTAFFHLVGYLIAGYLVLMGLINIYDDYQIKKATGSFGLGMASGIIFLVLAAAFLLFAPVIVSVLPFSLGVVIALNGLFQLITALNSKRFIWIIYSVIVLLAGFMLIFNPFKSFIVLFQVFGCVLIFMGISEIIAHFRSNQAR
ncbi:HdeD family acid-resistance protein [Enterococcus faecalis]